MRAAFFGFLFARNNPARAHHATHLRRARAPPAAALGIEPRRLPPGQSPTLKWPVLSLGPTPRVDRGSWLLSVDGAVEEPYVIDWQALMNAPNADWEGDIHCVARWSKFGMRWRGVAVSELLKGGHCDRVRAT